MLADSIQDLHTPTMSLKTAALLALIGMMLLTVLMAADFIKTVTGIMRDVVPAMALLRSVVYVVASLTVTVFFYVFYKKQS
jgi:hypothetical protein